MPITLPGIPWYVSAFLGGRGQDAVAYVRECRARILYDNGRRPAFQDAEGAHVDEQELDHGAWHFVARRTPDGPPLGYVRLATPAHGELFQTRAYLGPDGFAELLRADGLRPDAVFEHSRLVVEHRARKLGLGVHLNAVAIAAARALGAAAMVGTSGTKDGQDGFHERFGFGAVPGTRRYVPHYTEDVVVMLHRTADGAGAYADLVDRLVPELVSMTDADDRKTGPSPRHRPMPPAGLRATEPDRDSWRATVYEPADARQRAALTALLDSGAVREVHDTIDAQLDELVCSREPALAADPDAVRRRCADQLAGAQPWEYGGWAWYPWSGRLVHVLPREEFRLVRTDRNRGRIERPEQRQLLEHRIGVVGLSVGNSAAVTFALEGIGGAFRLADFDEFGLSNLNRLRAGVHQLGLNKAVLCARQLAEIDPYLDVEIHQDGLTEANLAEFFLGGDGPIDLLVEECDTPHAKLAAREQARTLGIPVVMDCNDRGMLDVERFDVEPDRPILHGLVGETKSGDVRDLSAAERRALILRMVDAQRISPQLAASFDEIGRTLSSWPQLASGVALGGALTAEVARRILLGQPCGSGRFYVDLDELIVPERSTVPATIGSR